ncbi:hypothetical protein LT493_20365 [Streptomyces tricolor]|nr:hypothetical protein [Streptomyces tricolor]
MADALWLARRLGAASSGGGDGGDPGTDAPGAPSARPPGPGPDAVPPDALTAAAPGTPQTPAGTHPPPPYRCTPRTPPRASGPATDRPTGPTASPPPSRSAPRPRAPCLDCSASSGHCARSAGTAPPPPAAGTSGSTRPPPPTGPPPAASCSPSPVPAAAGAATSSCSWTPAPPLAVWGEMVEELRQACQQSGAFASVNVHQLYADEAGSPLVGTTAGPGRRTRLRPADELHDPSGRRLTFVISDCVGPLWQNGTAQRLLHGWPRTAPLAVVQPLPPRLWGRTALPAEPGLLVRTGETGGRLDFLPEDEPWEETAARRPARAGAPAHPGGLRGLRPAARRHRTDPRTRLGRLRPPRHRTRGRRHRTAGAQRRRPAARLPRRRLARRPAAGRVPRRRAPHAARHAAGPSGPCCPTPVPWNWPRCCSADCCGNSPAPRTSPASPTRPGCRTCCCPPSTRTPPGSCSSTARPMWNGTSARAPATSPPWPPPGSPTTTRPQGPGRSPRTARRGDGTGSVEAELFARIPARVLRFYLPDLVTPDPLTEAERLLDRWRQLADPELLRRARNTPASPRRAAPPSPPPASPPAPAWSSAGCCARRPARQGPVRRAARRAAAGGRGRTRHRVPGGPRRRPGAGRGRARTGLLPTRTVAADGRPGPPLRRAPHPGPGHPALAPHHHHRPHLAAGSRGTGGRRGRAAAG